MKKVLVTGATGFIGRQCLPLLLRQGYEVHAVSSKTVSAIDENINWHQADLLDSAQMRTLLENVAPSHLLHLAWHVVPGKWATSSTRENFHWLQSGLHLIRSFHEAGGIRLVMAGSCTEYDWDYGYCSEYLTPRQPNTYYGKCKRALQLLLEEYSDEVGLSSAWGRIFFLYGPYENKVRLVSSVIRSLLLGEKAKCTHGNQIRDFLYVEDVADAFVALLESEVEGAVNIASGEPLSLKDLVQMIGKKLDRLDLVHMGAIQVPDHEKPLVVGDVTRLSKELMWFPKYSLAEGIDKTIEWWRPELEGKK